MKRSQLLIHITAGVLKLYTEYTVVYGSREVVF